MQGNLKILDNSPKPLLKQLISLYLQYSETNKKSYDRDVYSTKMIVSFLPCCNYRTENLKIIILLNTVY